ncbi:MAG: beta-hydroxyacyl-ACP dehydratase [Phycisphaerales bacterium]|nr:beta-hydroxyacyl-ACP dehydratase [Phycisphaerales bacterium]
MPPPPLIDPLLVANGDILVDREAIGRLNPQRYEFSLLHAVTHIDREQRLFGGYVEVRPDDWWARGHIPGRPLFPGVLQVECAAQLASFLHKTLLAEPGFLGFAGLDEVKFRGMVLPPARLVMIAKGLDIKRRRTICACQGFVGTTMVFEGVITGMLINY